jgi:hypothetical protein
MGAASFHVSHHAINRKPHSRAGPDTEGDWLLIKVPFVGVAPTFASADTSVASFGRALREPRAIAAGSVDFRSEIYSLGATMVPAHRRAALDGAEGPLAVQPTTIGLAVGKLDGMPKQCAVSFANARSRSGQPSVRSARALSPIQDCVAQVDRRNRWRTNSGFHSSRDPTWSLCQAAGGFREEDRSPRSVALMT